MKVACVQAEPVILDREATVDKLVALAAEAAGQGASLLVFPEAFIPVYPSSTWAKAFAGWGDDRAKDTFARIAAEAVAVPGEAADRIGEAAREHGVWIVTGVTEVDPERPGTLYNTLLYHGPDGALALRHRKLVPTNHERLIWGPGDGGGLRALPTELGRIGGLICWENYMPLARFALYESGVEIYIASTADDSRPGSRRSSISPASRARSSSRPRTSSASRPIRTTFRCATSSRASTSSAAGEARSSPRTAPTSPARSTTRRACSTPSSTRPCCWPSGSGSTRPGITTGRTCCS